MSAKKKVVFCTYSSIYSSKVLEQLIVDTDLELVAIVNSTRVISPSINSVVASFKQLKLSGLRYATYLFMVTGFFKFLQPIFKIKKWPLRHVHALAANNNIPITDTKDINSKEVVRFIEKRQPDFLLCAHFNQLIKAPVFSIKNLKCINIHPSILPNYKGVDPVFYAMKDGSKQIGVTLHEMNQEFDSGKILLQSEVVSDHSKSLLFNNCQLFEEGANLATRWIKEDKLFINKLLKNMQSLQLSNSESPNTYDSWPTNKDVIDFKKSGNRLMRFSGLWKQQ